MFIPNDLSDVRSHKWVKLSESQAKARNLYASKDEIVLINPETHELCFNSYLYFNDDELNNMESLN